MFNNREMIEKSKIIMTYSDLFQTNKREKEDIIRIIKSLGLKKSLILVSQFSTMDYKQSMILKNEYLRSFNKYISTEKLKEAKSQYIFSPQSLLNLYKWLLAYGELNEEALTPIDGKDILQLLHLELITADYLDEKDFNLSTYLLQNLFFSKKRDMGNDILRAFYIYTELSKKEELYDKNEFVDFNAEFEKRYGYTIKEYLAICFGLYTTMKKDEIELSISWANEIDDYFSNSLLKDVAPKVIDDLMTDISSLCNWSKETIDNQWDYSAFLNCPLLEVEKGKFIAFNKEGLENAIYMGLFHKIRECYPKEDTKFISFLGRPFEKYVEILVEKSISQAKIPYQLISEFVYEKNGNKRSSDLYIKEGNNLIIIEVKNAKPTVKTAYKGDEESINSDLQKLFISPLLQADKAYKAILKSNFREVFDGVTNIYIITLNNENIPPVWSLYDKVYKEVDGKLHPNVRGFFNFSIDEFEVFCNLITRRRPIFRVLNHLVSLKNISPLIDLLRSSSLPVKRTEWLRLQLNESLYQIMSMNFKIKDGKVL
ncbi:hypothetical protein BTJ45_04400 [Bacillus mycoides]|nr:hypothetical protein BTJ45_04400 [Bacillus mycoides]